MGTIAPNSMSVTIAAPPCTIRRLAEIACQPSPSAASFKLSAASHKAPLMKSVEKAA